MKTTIQKTISIEKETYNTFKKYADKNGLKFSTLINFLVVQYLKDHGVEVYNKYE